MYEIGVNAEFYYEEVIAPMIHTKYCHLESNFLNAVREVVMNEF